MKKCAYCWENVQDTAKKCRYCWEWFDEKHTIDSKEKVEHNINEKKPENSPEKELLIDQDNENHNKKVKKITSKTRLIWGIILSCSLIIIFILFTVISWIGTSIESDWFLDVSSYIMSFLSLISLVFLTPFWIYLLATNKWSDKKNENINNIEYIWFWERVWAHLIDSFLVYLIIPLFINLYYWFKNWQTIWYKIIWVKTFSVDWGKIKSASWLQLFFYPFLKILNILTLYIWFIMVWFTKKKQWLHNVVSNTVVVRVEKKNNKWLWIVIWIFISIIVFSILATIAFISLQWYSEDARQASKIAEQDSSITFEINNWLLINNFNKLINEEIDIETLSQINDDAERWFLTNKWNYILFIPEVLDWETAWIYADEANEKQNKLDLKSVVLWMWGKNITSEIKKIDWIVFYTFSYEIDIDWDLYYYFAIFWWKDLNFENIYVFWNKKEGVNIEWNSFLSNIRIDNIGEQ